MNFQLLHSASESVYTLQQLSLMY